MPGPIKKVERVREVQDDRWIFRFANGLTVHTDPFMQKDPGRVLPVGSPQDAIMSRIASLPELVAGKSVFDPCAGSGVLGLMALRLGAAHVDFLDINPRAQTFQQENARRNGFAPARYRTLLQSLTDFEVADAAAYDLVLCNPPFVPTPPGISGTLTSSGGPEGADLVDVLLARLDRWLRPDGQAFVCTMSLVAEGVPLVARVVERDLAGRSSELTSMQAEVMPFEFYAEAYLRLFPTRKAEIEQWSEALRQKYGQTLGLQHYVLHVQSGASAPAGWTVRADFLEKYGQVPYPSFAQRDLALARVMENVVPPNE